MDDFENTPANDNKYQSATKFNFRELWVIVLFAAMMSIFLVIPFMIGWIRVASGCDYDTFKEIPQGITPTQLLPTTGSPPKINDMEDGVLCSFLDGTQVTVRELPGKAEAIAAVV